MLYCSHMRTKRHDSWLNEFTVFGTFIAVSFVGFLYVGTMFVFGGKGGFDASGMEMVTAPTVGAYHEDARSVMEPFFGVAGQLTVDDIDGVREELLTIVETTQGRLIDLRVPSEEREAHLALVLLMEQWKRVLPDADTEQYAEAFVRTQDFVVAHPWITP